VKTNTNDTLLNFNNEKVTVNILPAEYYGRKQLGQNHSTFNRHFCAIQRPPSYRFFAAVESKMQSYSKLIVKGV